jgi:cell division protein FtsQ
MAHTNRRQSSSTTEARATATGFMEHFTRLFMVLLICLLAYGVYFTIQAVDRPLTRVTISGDFKNLDNSDLRVLVNQAISGGFLTVDLKNLKAVLQEHPWVSEVSVRRQWPSQLHINVSEEVPIARWRDDSFLNQLGQPLNIADNSKLHNLPLLTAQFGDSTQIMQQYQRLSKLLLPIGLKLSELKLDNLGAWQAETVKGIRLHIGREQVGEKIRRLVMVWQSGLSAQSDSIQTIDLRYPNGLAVAWRNSSVSTNFNHSTVVATDVHG